MEQISEVDTGPLITQSKPLIESSTNTKQIDFCKGKLTEKEWSSMEFVLCMNEQLMSKYIAVFWCFIFKMWMCLVTF